MDSKVTAIAALIFLVVVLSAGCSRHHVWDCPEGEEGARFRADVTECKAYARATTRKQAKAVKVPLSAPHGGVMGAFLAYGIFEEFFSQCMEAKGWRKKDQPGSDEGTG